MRKMMNVFLVILGLFIMTDLYAYEDETFIDNFSEKPWVIQAIPAPGFDHIIGKVQFGECKVINGPCRLPPYSLTYIAFTSNRKDSLLLGQIKLTDYKHVSMSFAYDDYNYKRIEVEPKETKEVILLNHPGVGDITIFRSNYRVN